MEPIDFSFGDVILKEIGRDGYTDFYNTYHYMRAGSKQGFSVGAFLNNKLIAACTISSITRAETAHKQNCKPNQIKELTRFCIHPDYQKKNFASWFMSKSTKLFAQKHKDIKKLVSFADTTQGHVGTIYKAANWIEDGRTTPSYYYLDSNGDRTHKKTLYERAKSTGKKESEYALQESYIKIPEKSKIRFIKNLT